MYHRSLASSSWDVTIRIWDTESGQTTKILKRHISSVNVLIVLQNESLASGSLDKTIRIWNTKSRQTIKILTGHTS